MATAEDVVEFWLNEIGQEGWYAGGEAVDAQCRERFGDALAQARAGGHREWLGRPKSALAYLILTDQFSRNIHRGTPEAFATDPLALSAAVHAVKTGLDLRIEGIGRQFFYMPFEHAETRQAQARAVCLFVTRMPDDPGDNLVHALAHREIIRRFGRFPFRNEVLGRGSSAAEAAFLKDEGYGGVVERLKA